MSPTALFIKINIKFKELFVTKLCNLCPRKCNVDRITKLGFCKSTNDLRISRVGLHNWEEPCISYGNGSGTMFFAGCNLRCVYCQNYEISAHLKGKDVSVSTLCDELLRLESMGAVNINLVTPTHYANKIAQALEKVKQKLSIPVVYNTSGYESVETLKKLDGLVDIYLTDLKYYSKEISKKYSFCEDYFDVAIKAICEMIRQTGKPSFNNEGGMQKGTLVRHLVLPSLSADSIEVFKALSRNIDVKDAAVSVMCQYFPSHNAQNYKEINRKTTTLEYMKVVDFVRACGFEYGFMQQRDSAKKEYVPIFDYN